MKPAFVFAVVLAFIGSGLSQVDSTTLHALYGNPVAEVFSIPPDIHTTVAYGSNQQICRLVLQPDKPTKFPDAEDKTRTLFQIVDAVVPSGIRGAKRGDMTNINGCSGQTTTTYEHVEIHRTVFSEINPTCETQMEVTVTFNSPDCAGVESKMTSLGRQAD